MSIPSSEIRTLRGNHRDLRDEITIARICGIYYRNATEITLWHFYNDID